MTTYTQTHRDIDFDGESCECLDDLWFILAVHSLNKIIFQKLENVISCAF